MQVPESDLNEVVSAINDSNSPSSSAARKAAANTVLLRLKTAEALYLLQLAPQLLGPGCSLEVQHYGYQILQQLVAHKWNRLKKEERDHVTQLAFQLTGDACRPDNEWPIRSKAAMLLAMVAKQSDPLFWQRLLPELFNLASQGAIQARLACLVFKGVTEEVTQYGDDLDSEAKRSLLHALMHSLDTVLPFLRHTMASSYGAAAEAASAGRMQDAQAHAATVTAALDALREHVEWAPVGKLAAADMLEALRFLVTTLDFRMAACRCLSLLSARKQAQEDPDAFKVAMRNVAEVLSSATASVLTPEAIAASAANGSMEEYVQSLCEAMATFGTLHQDCLTPGDSFNTFLHQMLALAQHSNLHIAVLALPFWNAMLSNRGDSPKAKTPPSVRPPALPLVVPATLSNLAGDHLRRSVAWSKDVPDGFEDWAAWQAFMQEWRSQLSAIMKHLSRLLPEEVLTAAAQGLQAALNANSPTQNNSTEDPVIQYENAIAFLECVVPPIAAGQQKVGVTGANAAVMRLLEQVLQQLLAAKVTDASRALALARAIETFGPLVNLKPQLAPVIIDKVFDMLADMPLESGPLGSAPPARLPAGWKDRFSARQRITNIILVHAKAAPQAIVPHMQTVAVRMEGLSQHGKIWASDSNVICDGLMAAAACDPSVHPQVVEWVLGPVRAAWTSPQWQQRLGHMDAFLSFFLPLQQASDSSVQVGGGDARWELYHHLHLLERIVKRLPASNCLGVMGTASPSAPGWHAVNAHLSWTLPVLLQIVQCLHALWTPQMQSRIQLAVSALDMSLKERALHLRVPHVALPEEEETTLGGGLVSSLRSFLRQVRELVYQSLGLMASQVGGCLCCTPMREQWVQAVTGHLEHVNMQHMRILLRHFLLPVTRTCPTDLREAWLLPILAPVLQGNLQHLNAAWSSVSGGGAGQQRESAAAANAEVVQEHLLREMTTEHLLLLCMLHDHSNGGLSVFLWLVKAAPSVAHTAALTATAALWWPHGEAIVKAAAFCKGVVQHALKLGGSVQELVTRDMLRGCVTALATGSGAAQAELLGLARDIIALRQPLTRQVLQSLPRATEQLLAEFEQSFEAAAAEKDSRLAVKTLLRDAGAEELANRLSDWKPLVPVTRISSRGRHSHNKTLANGDSDDVLLGINALNESSQHK